MANNIKKFISIILSISVLLSPVVFAADAGEKKSPAVTKALEVLKALEFVNEDYDVEVMDFSKKVTRADFAYLAGRMFNTADISSETLYFYDVPKDHFAFKEITYLASQNMISGRATKMFYPECMITIQEAASIVIRGLGYGLLLDFDGEWPNNVNLMIERLDLCKNIAISGDMTYNDMFIMLYNLLDIEVLEFNGSSYKSSGKTFLSTYYDIYHETGVVKGYDEIDYGLVASNKGQAVINKTIFEANGIDLSMLIGCEVEYMYRYDESADVYTLLWVESTGKTDVLKISYFDEDVTFNADAYEISYYNNNNRKQTACLDRGINLIYNGSLVSSDVEKILSSKFDTLCLIDEDNNGKYEVGIMYAYENYIIGNHDVNNAILYDADATKSFNYGDYDRVDVYSADGNKGSIADITVGSVASVYASIDLNRAIIYMSSVTVEGYVNSFSVQNGKSIFSIDNVDYIALPDTVNIQEKNKKAGQTVSLKLDFKGRIAYLELTDESVKYGYMIQTYLDNNLDETLWVKIFTEDGEMQKYKAYEKLKIDGTSYQEQKDAYMILGGGDVTPQLIRYELNKDNLLKSIDTVEENSDGTDSLYITNVKGSRTYKGGKFTANNGKAYRAILIDSNTRIFSVPSDPGNAEDDDYYIKSRDNLNDWRTMLMESYSVDEDNFFEEALVVYDCNWGKREVKDQYVMVDSMAEKLNEDDEIITEIRGFSAGAEITVECSDNCVIPEIHKGDLLFLTYDSYDRISTIDVRYSVKEKVLPAFVYDHYNNYVFTMGYVTDIKENAIKIRQENSTEDYDDIYTVGTVWIYDSGINKVIKGTAADIVSAKQDGQGNIVALATSQGYVTSCFVYK